MERRIVFFLSKYLHFVLPLGLIPLILVASLTIVPVFRFMAVLFLAGSVVSLAFVNFRLSRRHAQLADIHDHMEIVTQRQRYLIAAEIHQSVNQLLFATTLVADRMLTDESAYPPEILTGLNDLRQLTSGAYTAIRHITLGLRPTRIHEVPLEQLINELVQIKRFGTETEIQCMTIGTAHYPSDIHYRLYQIVDLMLSNSVLHAQASFILVRLLFSQDEAIISVEDNGCGFDHAQLKAGHFGLEDIDLFAREIGATIDWHTLPGPHPKKITCIWRRPSWNEKQSESS